MSRYYSWERLREVMGRGYRRIREEVTGTLRETVAGGTGERLREVTGRGYGYSKRTCL